MRRSGRLQLAHRRPGTTIVGISPKRIKRSLSTWRTRSAHRWFTQLRKAPAGASEPPDTANGVSATRPQNQDSPMSCRAWTPQIFIGSEWQVIPSQNTYNSGLRRAWRDPAPEDTNNILARWNKEERAKATRKSGPGTRHPVDNQNRHAAAGPILRTGVSAWALKCTFAGLM